MKVFSCELISKLYFCVSNHKRLFSCRVYLWVVNWFQNCIFVWAITRWRILRHRWDTLWIDFKIVFLCEQSQALAFNKALADGCELISKLYFCVSNHKKERANLTGCIVVNWFQNCIFVWAITSSKSLRVNRKRLWIDFKIVFLCEQSQVFIKKTILIDSCELISKLYFCVSNHKQRLFILL